jgi:hypothetical protein
MPHLKIDTSRFPLVVCEFDGSFSEEQAVQFCDELRTVLEQRKRIIMVTDLRTAKMTSLKARGIMREFTKESMHLSNAYTAASAIIITAPIIRMTVSAMFHLTRPKYPVKVFKHIEEGTAWVREQLDIELGSTKEATPDEGEDLMSDDSTQN